MTIARHLTSVTARMPAMTPRLLAFYRDAWDDEGTVIGWQTVAWGLVLSDGSAISIPVEPPARVTLWHSVDDIVTALDAYVDNPDPRRTIDNGRDVSPLPRPSTVPPAPVDGAAARPACPEPDADWQGTGQAPGHRQPAYRPRGESASRRVDDAD